jgi:hypothetical protein
VLVLIRVLKTGTKVAVVMYKIITQRIEERVRQGKGTGEDPERATKLVERLNEEPEQWWLDAGYVVRLPRPPLR